VKLHTSGWKPSLRLWVALLGAGAAIMLSSAALSSGLAAGPDHWMYLPFAARPVPTLTSRGRTLVPVSEAAAGKIRMGNTCVSRTMTRGPWTCPAGRSKTPSSIPTSFHPSPSGQEQSSSYTVGQARIRPPTSTGAEAWSGTTMPISSTSTMRLSDRSYATCTSNDGALDRALGPSRARLSGFPGAYPAAVVI